MSDLERCALDLTLALPAEDAVQELADALLTGRFARSRKQPGHSTWLRTKTKPWMVFLGVEDSDITPWVEKFTGKKVSDWGTLPQSIELTPYPDPRGTRVRILPQGREDTYKVQMVLQRDLQAPLSDLADRGVLLEVSDWIRPDWPAEWLRQREEKKAARTGRRATS